MAEQSAPSRSAIHTTGDEAPVLFRDPKQDQLSSSVWDVERGTWRGVDRKPPTRTCLGAAHGVGPGRARATQRGSWRVTPHPRVQEGRGQATSIPFRPSTTWLSGCSRGPWTLSQRRSSSAAVLGARTGVHQQRVLHPLLPRGLEQLVGARGGAAGGGILTGLASRAAVGSIDHAYRFIGFHVRLGWYLWVDWFHFQLVPPSGVMMESRAHFRSRRLTPLPVPLGHLEVTRSRAPLAASSSASLKPSNGASTDSTCRNYVHCQQQRFCN